MNDNLTPRQQQIVDSWKLHEQTEPDISTEKLMAMVKDDTGAEVDEQIEALQCADRAGLLKENKS